MKHFKVLGFGCKNCQTTAELIEAKAKQAGVDVTVDKETDMSEIMRYGVMSTPGVVLDEKVIHAGSVPNADTVAEWLNG